MVNAAFGCFGELSLLEEAQHINPSSITHQKEVDILLKRLTSDDFISQDQYGYDPTNKGTEPASPCCSRNTQKLL